MNEEKANISTDAVAAPLQQHVNHCPEGYEKPVETEKKQVIPQ